MFSSKDLFFTTPSGYTVSKSLRFRSSASAYLNRTAGASATNQNIGTWSFWLKRGTLGANQRIFEGYTASTDAGTSAIEFNSTDNIVFGGWTVNYRISTQVFRDPSAFYHFVVAIDTTQSTANNRVKIYVNGAEITAFSTTNNPTQNTTFGLNNNSSVLQIGRRRIVSSNDLLFDGYLAEVNFIDGQALTPTSFGFYDTNGIWQPKGYTGTYGTNGYYLKFTDTTSTTTLVADSSGNSNNWTPNNISLTSGTTYDSMIDSPANYADGGNGRGNYAVLNPLTPSSVANSGSVINGNLDVSINSAVYCGYFSTMQLPSSGKWYWEGQCSQNSTVSEVFSFGVASPTLSTFNINQQTGAGVYWWSFTNARYLNLNGTNTNTATTYTAGTVVMAAYDADNQKLYLGIGGTWYSAVNTTTTAPDASGSPVITTNLSGYYPAIGAYGLSNTSTINFGQRPFTYTPPSGYSALNTQNLTTPTIANGAQYMAAVTYTGDSNSGTVVSPTTTNSGNNPLPTTFQPDFVWIKNRSNTGGAGFGDHMLYDVVRGVLKNLSSNLTDAEGSVSTGLSAFNTTGFTPGTSTRTNQTGNTYVGWQWNAGGSTVTNTSGSITSSVRASTTAGFSVVTYTGTGANATVGHGLGVAPGMVIVKQRDAVTDWFVYHTGLPAATNFIRLDLTNAYGTNTTVWNSTAPSSSVISLGTYTEVNASTKTYVAYCFAPVSGYSAFGSYTGNGSADGPFVYTGFRPRYIMWKRTDAVASWLVYDTSRSTYNVMGAELYPNLSDAEATSTRMDFLSNGFKLRAANAADNASGGTYIYAAFAENPFKISRAR